MNRVAVTENLPSTVMSESGWFIYTFNPLDFMFSFYTLSKKDLKEI